MKLTPEQRALRINEGLAGTGLYSQPKQELAYDQNSTWQIASHPLTLSEGDVQFFNQLGGALYRFYQACNLLYFQSVKGIQPSWVSDWLDQGKDERVQEYARLRRFRSALPVVIRPDVIPLKDGYSICELDSVPGGMGILGALSELYSKEGNAIIGGSDGIVTLFVKAMMECCSQKENPVVAIVVSDESEAYRHEMLWLAKATKGKGIRVKVLHPRDIRFQEDGLYIELEGDLTKIDLIYRFFELFDLKNIPKIDLLLYAVKKGLVEITPPLKHHLEEKMLLALFHHPILQTFWRTQLTEETHDFLMRVFPQTWVMDPTPSPPHTIIPGLSVGDRAVSNWEELKIASQKERRFVIKPSGFSPLAWGSHGVKIGHDLSQAQWGAAIDEALTSFPHTPYVLQRFNSGKEWSMPYYDFASRSIKHMKGRARLCPYYLIKNKQPELAGILATICPLNKKVIHGMVDAIMTPCTS